MPLPIGVLAVEAFRATDPVTFEETWSTASIEAATQGAYRRAYVGSLQLSVITALLGAVVGPAVATAVLQARRGRLLRRLVLTAPGVLANFGGIPLAFAFLAAIGSAGVVTALLTDTLGLGLGGVTLLLFASAFVVYAAARALVGSSVPLVTLQIANALSGDVVVGSENVGKAPALGMVLLAGLVMIFYAWVQRRTRRWLS